MGKRAKPEEVIAKLREIEIRLARGETAAAAARAVGVTEQSYYRWRIWPSCLSLRSGTRLCTRLCNLLAGCHMPIERAPRQQPEVSF